MVPILGISVALCNLAVNGPCAVGRFLEDFKSYYGNAFVMIANDPYALMDFVESVCMAGFFLATPLIHLTLMVNVLLTKNWTKLWLNLEKIQQNMKLNEEFYCKCRLHCFIILGLLILVNCYQV